jgi:hypothetical protein
MEETSSQFISVAGGSLNYHFARNRIRVYEEGAPVRD